MKQAYLPSVAVLCLALCYFAIPGKLEPAKGLDGFAVAPPTEIAPAAPSAAPIAPEPARVLTLPVYCMAAVDEWRPPFRAFVEETAEQVEQRLSVLVDAVLYVALSEPALPRMTKTETALAMLAEAAIESKYALFVEDGRCNDATWRASLEGQKLAKGDCDKGVAFTVWQMHIDEQGPVRLTETGWSKHEGRLVVGTDVIGTTPETQALAARVALHWFRQNPEVWGSWPGAVQDMRAWVRKNPTPPGAP